MAISNVGWLYSLSVEPNSVWGSVADFYKDVEACPRRKGRIIINSWVWGNMRSTLILPQPGDGFAFYHSWRAKFPAPYRHGGRPRISLVGTLEQIQIVGREVRHIKVSVDPAVLAAIKPSPIIRDSTTTHIFQQAGIVWGSHASLYHADGKTWKQIMALLP